MKKNLLFLIFFFVSATVMAQDFTYGNADEQALDMKKYDKDTSAHAVVIQEYGSSRITVASDDDIKLIYEYHVKVKIFDSHGFDNATVAIKVRNDAHSDSREEVTDITGITYYKDENGLTQQATLDPKKVYTTRDYKYQSTMKFTMPGLRNGCVIEYKYRLESPLEFSIDNFRPWKFQSDIPKIYSEYETHIPAHFNYNAVLRGSLKLTKSKAEVERGCFSTHGASSDCSNMVYGMSDIPAFIEEDYMTSPNNFISAISFELVDWTNPYTGVKRKVTQEWSDIDYQLKVASEFGGQLKKEGLLKDRIAPVLVGKSDELEKTKAIYAYLQKWFKWNDYIGIYSNEGIKKALDSHSGSIADINLCLVTALKSAGIHAEAVVLSTRDNGFVNTLYPSLGDFNYVIAKANIGDKSYLLDATDPLMPFGMLPLKCLNDKGRVFSLDKPSYWIDMTTQQREVTTYSFDLTLQDNGKLKGTITNYSSGYSSYLKRKAIKKFNTVDEYVENLGEKLPKLKILKSSVLNLDSLDMPVEEIYDVELDIYDNLNHDRLLFNPFIMSQITTNPFKLTERDYPVDWGMPSDERYILTVHLPAQYIIENPPQNVSVYMPNKGGAFLTTFESDNNTFTFSHVTKFNKSIYAPEEYPYLKELYNKIILSEKNELIFKKK